MLQNIKKCGNYDDGSLDCLNEYLICCGYVCFQISAHIEFTKKLPIGWCYEFLSMFTQLVRGKFDQAKFFIALIPFETNGFHP